MAEREMPMAQRRRQRPADFRASSISYRNGLFTVLMARGTLNTVVQKGPNSVVSSSINGIWTTRMWLGAERRNPGMRLTVVQNLAEASLFMPWPISVKGRKSSVGCPAPAIIPST